MAIYQELSFLAITLMWEQGTITLVDHVLMVEVEFVHLSLCDLYVNTQWASEWLMFNTKWTVFQLYHDESTYLVSEWLMFNTKWTVFQLYHDKSTYLVSEWLMFNTKWTVFQLYHDESTYILYYHLKQHTFLYWTYNSTITGFPDSTWCLYYRSVV